MTNKALMGAAFAGLLMTTVGCASTHHSSSPKMAQGECHGVNSCKGQGACGGAGHSCAGHNECKGKGWLKMSEAACSEAGGTYKN